MCKIHLSAVGIIRYEPPAWSVLIGIPSMNIRKHLILFAITLSAWAGFFLLGFPSDYFVEWSLAEKTLLTLVTAFAVVPYIAFFVLLFLGGNYFKTSIWFAFYASVLVGVLDFIVVSMIQGRGMHFVISHWPQTLGYVYVWVSIPLVGSSLNRITKKEI